MQKVMVYGTLKQGGALSPHLASSKFLGTGVLPKGYQLYDMGWFPGLAEVPEGFDQPIEVEVYEVSSDVLSTLDMVEGHPSFYLRKLKKVELPGKEEAAWVYTQTHEEMRGNRIIEGGSFDVQRN